MVSGYFVRSLSLVNYIDSTWTDEELNRLITTKEKRLSTLDAVKAHPFFRDVNWAGLRDSRAPFIPALDSEIESVVPIASFLRSHCSP